MAHAIGPASERGSVSRGGTGRSLGLPSRGAALRESIVFDRAVLCI